MVEKKIFFTKNMLDNFKVGVIGMGKMGFLHSGIFNNLGGCNLSTISDTNNIILKVLKQFIPDIKIYQNYEQMLENEQINIVVITTPVFLHKRMIEKALSHNIHVFVEKPFTLNGNECKSILNKSYMNKCMVGYCRRFMGTYKMAKNVIESKELGYVHDFNAHLFVGQVFHQGKGWLYHLETSGGGVLIDLGSHAIDMIHYIIGNIKKIHARGKSIYNKEVEDYVSVKFNLDNDVFGSLETSWSMKNYRLPELYFEIHLDEGTIITTEKYINIFSEKDTHLFKRGWNIYYKQQLTEDVPIDLGGPEYTLEDLHFLHCIINNEKPLCDFQEAAKTNFVIDKIYTSIKNDTDENIQYEV